MRDMSGIGKSEIRWVKIKSTKKQKSIQKNKKWEHDENITK